MPDHALVCSHAVHVVIILERDFVAPGRDPEFFTGEDQNTLKAPSIAHGSMASPRQPP